MAKRAAVQGRPFAFARVYAASKWMLAFQHTSVTSKARRLVFMSWIITVYLSSCSNWIRPHLEHTLHEIDPNCRWRWKPEKNAPFLFIETSTLTCVELVQYQNVTSSPITFLKLVHLKPPSFFLGGNNVQGKSYLKMFWCATRLISMILFETRFDHIITGLVHHAANMVCRMVCGWYQPSAAKSRIVYKAGKWPLSCFLRKEAAVAMPYTLQSRQVRVGVIIVAYGIFTVLLNVDLLGTGLFYKGGLLRRKNVLGKIWPSERYYEVAFVIRRDARLCTLIRLLTA